MVDTRRHSTAKEFNQLAAQLRNIEEHPRNIAARASEALTPSAGHGVVFQIDANNRNRARRLPHGTDRIGIRRKNDAAFKSNKLTSEFVSPVHSTVKARLY